MQGWNVQTQAQVFSASYSNQGNTYLAPVISNGSLYAGGGYYGGQVYSYNTSNSATNWASNVQYSGSFGGATPAVDANYVYATGGLGSDLLVLNRSTGALVSETGPHQEAGSGSPLLTGNGGLFYIQNGNGYFLDISNPASPQVRWTFPQFFESSAPAYAKGVLYLSGQLNTSPTLYAVNAATGAIEWSLAGVAANRNLVVTDNVLFAAEAGDTVAVSLQTHQVLWSVPTQGPMALSDGELFIGSDANVVAYAVPEPSTVFLLGTGACFFLRRRRR